MTNQELYRKISSTKNLLQIVIQRMMQLFGVCRLTDDRKLKSLVFGSMEGKNKRERPHREWTDAIVDWGKSSLQELSHIAQDRAQWRRIVERASDINGR
jgi:hypothetical protein